MMKSKRVVVKVGTKVLTSKERALDTSRIEDIVFQLSRIIERGIEVILVTSGAIGAGMSLLNIKRRPVQLASLQATASVGQSHLMHLYSQFFKRMLKKDAYVGQVLLTQEDFDDRKRYLNIRHTINTLLKYNAIPIINENDAVATDEIRCGDNDRLSSLVADLCGADKLIMLTDVDGLLDEEGSVIKVVYEITPRILKLAGKSHCDLGTGGMTTKVEAARRAVQAGIECVIANGTRKNVLYRMLVDGEALGTSFKRQKTKLMARKRWIAFSSNPKGSIQVDGGARDALLKNKSLLASGILDVSGDFVSGDVVGIVDSEKREFARGVTHYSSMEIGKIKGFKTTLIRDVLGYKGRDEVVHKDNLVIL